MHLVYSTIYQYIMPLLQSSQLSSDEQVSSYLIVYSVSMIYEEQHVI